MKRLATLFWLAALAEPAFATPYALDPGRSAISFTYLESGSPKEGRFARLEGRAEFDPAQPERAEVRLTVSSAGVDLGDPMRSFFAQSVDWFDAEEHPAFTVTLHGLEAIGPGRYRARGAVTIKGHEVGIAPELELREEAGGLRASGTLVLNRHDYLLGIGFSSLFASVGTEVTVHFNLAGSPVR
jgi:polyisoprenoid-binding protein YceI